MLGEIPQHQPVMVSSDRQRVIETNRSLRLIKNELESLLEKGIITDEAFDSITSLLPAESSLASARTPAALPTPAPSVSSPSPASTPAPSIRNAPPSNTNTNKSDNHSPAPPSYAQSTSTPPALPIRNNPNPPAAPEKPVLARARALYRYAAGDARDCSFERDDMLAVHEYMNGDWWMGRNERTGQEGIFPRSYVVVVDEGEKKQEPVYPAQPQYAQPQSQGQYPLQPQYGYPAAPSGMAQPYQPGQQQPQGQQGEGEGGSKIGEHGKKFGKKLGNAAIFGAGATIGSNIVNSIF